MINHYSLMAAVACHAAIAMQGIAQEPDGHEAPLPDKSRYHLFNPTPPELMREMSTDRPDKTESPYTVDAGHYQVEMDFVNYVYDRYNPERARVRVESWSYAPINLKAGLLNNLDLQLVLEPYTTVRVRDLDRGVVEKARGFGDTVVRSKINLWGNDGGRTALALMPAVKFPTSDDELGNNAVEWALMVPFAMELPGGWSMGLMGEVDWVRDLDGSGYHAEWIGTITFGRDIIGNLGGFVEFFGLVSDEGDSDWVGTFDVGFTYAFTKNLQLDGGVNIGVSRAAPDWNPFLGLSWRF